MDCCKKGDHNMGDQADIKARIFSAEAMPNFTQISMEADDKFYMTNKDAKIHLFEFKRDIVKGYWANLNLEKTFYLNDSEDRFSNCPEPYQFRRLVSQLAEAPAGRPAYSTGVRAMYF
jgi:hypothetical protein